MKVYIPVGYYNDPKDIFDLYPSSTFKGDEADIIVKYFKDGYGNFHSIDYPDVDSYITPEEASKANDVVFTSDGQYIVVFSAGNRELLMEGSYDHGFYIDIYCLEDDLDYEYEPVESGIPEPERDIKEMSDDELYDYTLDLTRKTKEAVFEMMRRKTGKVK